MMKIKNFLSRNFCKTACVCACLAGLLFVSCADEDLVRPETSENKGALVRFNVIDAQSEATASASSAYMTRAAFAELLLPQGLTPEDLVHQTLPSVTSDGTEACLVETTVAGVNPVKQDENNQTRANISEELPEKFSAIGYNGATKESVETITSAPWFHGNEVNKNGQMTTPTYWDKNKPYARFYGVSPHASLEYKKVKLSDGTYTSTPYVDFEVEDNVKDQKDLMTASSEVVHYDGGKIASPVDLTFRHALTAVRFKVGQNLSYDKTIEKVEIRGAKSEGRYTLASGKEGKNEAWSELKKEATFTLSGLDVSTSADVNQVILGDKGDDGVFYMVPQKLENVSVYITFTDKTIVKTKLSGSWEPGTTKTYALSEKNSTWKYVLTATSPIPIDYTATSSEKYTVQSYREVDGRQEAVSWEVVGYDADGDNNFTMAEKPDWLTSPGATEGRGGFVAEQLTATLKTSIANRLDEYNKALQTAPAKGDVGKYYNLSNANGEKDIENTANSYLISAPGYYCIPLVYGNAIKDGYINDGAFKTEIQGNNILKNFQDHNGKDIANAYIDTQNTEDPATQASVVWEDQKGIVDNPYVDGYFVRFHISKEKIRSGNAVIAVKNSQGVIMWSWHLWFAQKEALDVVAIRNHQGQTYRMTKETLGFAYTKWQASSYDKERVVRVKIQQTVANGGDKQTTYINITQKPGGEKEVSSTYYQFGRKDPFPIEKYEVGAYTVIKKAGAQDISTLIQNPGIFYKVTDSPYDVYNKTYNNLWSMNNSSGGFKDEEVVKTIYDPCPVGFKMPPSNAFTGFTTTGDVPHTAPDWRRSGTWDKGWHFKSGDETANTVYFPAAGYRLYDAGTWVEQNARGRYWSAIPKDRSEGCGLKFSDTDMNPKFTDHRGYGYAVRPIAE